MSETVATNTAGAATGGVKTLLRLEGLTLFAGMVVLYGAWDGSWWIFAILFLAPDLSFLAYLSSSRTGALAYHAARSYMAPASPASPGLGVQPTLTTPITT